MSGFIKVRVSFFAHGAWSEAEATVPMGTVLLANNRKDALCVAAIPCIEHAAQSLAAQMNMTPSGIIVEN